MSDPRRWLEGDEASSDEKALLRSELGTEAPSETVDEIWACLAALPTGGGPEGGASSPEVVAKGASPSGSLGALGAKLALGTLVLAGAGLGLWLGIGREQTKVQATAPSSAVVIVEREAPKPVMVQAEPAEKPKAEISNLPKVAPKARAVKAVEDNPVLAELEKPKEPIPASDLLEESRALEASRNSISRGEYDDAVRGLSAMEARFPKGILGQEREALTIEALWKSGQRQMASQRAADFFQRFPDSPHGARLRRFVSSP